MPTPQRIGGAWAPEVSRTTRLSDSCSAKIRQKFLLIPLLLRPVPPRFQCPGRCELVLGLGVGPGQRPVRLPARHDECDDDERHDDDGENEPGDHSSRAYGGCAALDEATELRAGEDGQYPERDTRAYVECREPDVSRFDEIERLLRKGRKRRVPAAESDDD